MGSSRRRDGCLGRVQVGIWVDGAIGDSTGGWVGIRVCGKIRDGPLSRLVLIRMQSFDGVGILLGYS